MSARVNLFLAARIFQSVTVRRFAHRRGGQCMHVHVGAISRYAFNRPDTVGTNNEKTVRQWFVDHHLIESFLYRPEVPFDNTIAPGIVLFVHADLVFKAGATENSIAPEGTQRIADTLVEKKRKGTIGLGTVA